MLKRSPFAVATAGAPLPSTPDFAKDLYVANAAHSTDGDFVTLASTTDKNCKGIPEHEGNGRTAYSISNIQWSDQVGETKVTITKDGQFATLTFNEALLSQAIQNPVAQIPQPLQQGIPGRPVGNATDADSATHAGAADPDSATACASDYPAQCPSSATDPPATAAAESR